MAYGFKYNKNTLPDQSEAYQLNIFGFGVNKKSQKKESNFVNNIDLKTEITKNYATMLTVGATANK